MSERKRRPSGDGSARPKGLGWEIRFKKQVRRHDDDPRLKGHNSRTQINRWKSSGAIPRPVREALRDLISDVERGTQTDARKISFATYVVDTWLPHHGTRVRPSTLKRNEELLRLHVLPVIGRMRLGALRPVHVQKVVDEVAAKVLSAGTQVLVYRVMSASLSAAVRWQLVAVNAAKAIRPPRVERPMLNVPDRDQIARILHVSRDTWIEQPVLLAASTGMRLGETLGLRWKDVDLDSRVLRVTQSVEWAGRDFAFTQPKSSRSRRTISLPSFAIDALRRWRKEQNERRLIVGRAWVDHDLVIDDGLGRALRTDSVSSAFRTLMKVEGVQPRPRFHDLRHGYATALLASNVHPKIVSEALGHASVAFTLDTYSHVIPSLGQQAADAIQAALGPQ